MNKLAIAIALTLAASAARADIIPVCPKPKPHVKHTVPVQSCIVKPALPVIVEPLEEISMHVYYKYVIITEPTPCVLENAQPHHSWPVTTWVPDFVDSITSSGGPRFMQAPEIDPGSTGSALTLLAGGIAILVSRRK